MLTNFYKILAPENPVEDRPNSSSSISREFRIELNVNHPVYQGHFPGNPVVPGVCQVQIITELVSLALHLDVNLIQADNIKYLSMINPLQTRQLNVKVEIKATETQPFPVSASISANDTLFIKFKGVFFSKLREEFNDGTR